MEAWSLIRQLVAWLVILAVTAILAVAVLIPRITGATPYTILTGSMRPTLPPGTLVVVRPVEADEIRPGTVITYQLKSGRPAVATHRVIGQRVNAAGEMQLRTQGDANDSPDKAWVTPAQVRGEVWYAVPLLGHVNNIWNGDEKQMLVHLVAAALLGYAVFMLTGAVRDRVRGRKASS